jgi:NAD(P)-dependent dehydrogenase (short-subunit alcohol dehydrogenase family)
MSREPLPITGRVVAISGGARGIGRATAAALVRRGARVAIGDLDAEAAEAAAAELGHGTVGLPLDVTDAQSYAEFLDAAEQRLGELDVVINNAGICHIGAFLDQDAAADTRMVDVNLRGVLNGSRLALERFTARGYGHLVNVASSAGKLSPAGFATYAATKHAVVGLTEALRVEHLGSGIEFSIVMPGVVNTEMIDGYKPVRAVQTVEPGDVAAAIVGALERPRRDVYVPRSVGPIGRLLAVLPVGAADAIARALRVDTVGLDADMSARTAYEARAAASDPSGGAS